MSSDKEPRKFKRGERMAIATKLLTKRIMSGSMDARKRDNLTFKKGLVDPAPPL